MYTIPAFNPFALVPPDFKSASADIRHIGHCASSWPLEDIKIAHKRNLRILLFIILCFIDSKALSLNSTKHRLYLHRAKQDN